MRSLTCAQIREKYITFFEKKGCKHMDSASLIPDDPSLLLTSAGMVQFKPYFLHIKELEEPYVGTVTAQKCVRTNDIDIIGTTGRHLSFFEMLGNFSFGKYFKDEMCAWSLEFCLDELELDKNRLYFTVFEDDDETIEIWKGLGIDPTHISRLGEDDNFWRAGPTGPCGPCSEIYYDQGPHFGCGLETCAPGCDCDRYLEFWNLVFTQYDGQEDGSLKPLKTKNIDTGMGLERMASILQGVQSNYETDIMRALLSVGERLSNVLYGTEEAHDLSLRIIADHSRSVTFMIADGILPSNEGRGYVLRRLLRRAVLHAHKLGINEAFLHEYIHEIIKNMGDVYIEIVDNKDLILKVVASEEERFRATLKQGQAYLDEQLQNLQAATLSGKAAFVLHDTYGFPLELTKEICAERNVDIDIQDFEVHMQQQRQRARSANTKDAEAAWSTYGSIHDEIMQDTGATKFVGYDLLHTQSTVVAIISDGKRVSEATSGEEVELILDVTPFYAEMGGQVGDTGAIVADAGRATVADTQAKTKGLISHIATIEVGSIHVGDVVKAEVDETRRNKIIRNHTATHILHAALKRVLGSHVNQAGSYVGPDYLRFDFTHFSALSADEIARIEQEANDVVMAAIATSIYETTLDKARAEGVTALFGEKYGNTVRVVQAGDYSSELCGGCHVTNTSEIGFIRITNESSVGASTRRIEAVTSYEAFAQAQEQHHELQQVASLLKVGAHDISRKVEQMQARIKELESQVRNAQQNSQQEGVDQLLSQAIDVGFPLLIARIDGQDASMLRNMWDIIKTKMSAGGACVLASDNNGSPILMAAATQEAVEKGFNAGDVIRAI
ncbi:MAG: alanine--tRNA ligase, partial [Eggerthellaceae bacterium]|nr:alanine--tRNA ligase [Eggerthellaceae bacterium]